MSLVSTYTFEEGTAGTAIPSGSNGVIAEGAAVTYVTPGIHGNLGAGMATLSSSLVYSLPVSVDNSWSDSFYVQITATSANSSLVGSIRSTATLVAKLNLDPLTGSFRILDSGGTQQATSTVGWSVGQLIRNDLHYSYDGANLHLTWQLFIGANAEGSTPDETLTASFAVIGTPNRLALGGISTGWAALFDSYRQYNSSTDVIAPFGRPPLQLYDGSTLAPASLYLAAAQAVPTLSVDFEDGTTGAFTTVQGATVSSTAAYSGSRGCRLAPAAGTSYATLSYNAAPSGHAWARFRGQFRIVVPTAGSYTNVFEIGNSLTVSPKDQFTLYMNGPRLMMDFRTGLDATVVDAQLSIGAWHSIEVSVNYGGSTYVATVACDGRQLPAFSSSVVCTPATVGTLWLGYPSTATDQTIDWDDIIFAVGDTDPAHDVSIVPASTTLLTH